MGFNLFPAAASHVIKFPLRSVNIYENLFVSDQHNALPLYFIRQPVAFGFTQGVRFGKFFKVFNVAPYKNFTLPSTAREYIRTDS
jgi:hypothetical protein